MAGKISHFFILILLVGSDAFMCAQREPVLQIKVTETAGIDRNLEYVEIPVDLPPGQGQNVVMKEADSGEWIPCQVILKHEDQNNNTKIGSIIFPVNLAAGKSKTFDLYLSDDASRTETDLLLYGEGVELIVENQFYRADLTRSDQSEAKSHSSGQLRELLMKMGYNVLFFRTENRMHWAPNFQREDQENYQNISGWENPEHYQVFSGPYLVRTERRDRAPGIPEIDLSAIYSFYAGMPWFRFYSAINVTADVNLTLLRNDEMTMDSMFTHVAFERPDGQVEDLTFAEREMRLKEKPVEADANWLCFYNADKGYAWGSIRLGYDNRNEAGEESPTYNAHTKISDGAEGGKYWNRRLIDENLTRVPGGSLYREENAYIVFSIQDNDKFAGIKNWRKILKNPLQTTMLTK